MFDWGWHMGGFGMLIWIAVLVLVVWLIVRLTTQSNSGHTNSNHAEHMSTKASAKEILDERYARGEITRDQFLQMKQDLDRV